MEKEKKEEDPCAWMRGVPWDSIKPGMTKTPKSVLIRMGATYLNYEMKARASRSVYEDALKNPTQKDKDDPQLLVKLRESQEALERNLKEYKFRLNLMETLIADGFLTGYIAPDGSTHFLYLENEGVFPGHLPIGYIINEIKVKDVYTDPETFRMVDQDGQLFKIMDEVEKRTYRPPKKEEPKPSEQPSAPEQEEPVEDEEEIPEVGTNDKLPKH